MKQRRTNPVEYMPTAADYIAKAVCPFLIMLLVGSLTFFIEEVVYRGAQELRLKWLIFWCVLGMVGISRIAIEKTAAYAGMYALLLGGATVMFVSRFFHMPAIGWLLLAIIWWCTNKLVWDCTLIDEKTDASGEGLLEIAGMDETRAGDQGEQPRQYVDSKTKLPLWKKLFTNAREETAQPHAPGLWVVYFSVAALPVFGFGQLIMARLDQRTAGLLLVIVYLASAISLLLMTSFLGLRRYLRQRRLKMPGTMASRWITTGSFIAGAVLLIGLMLPRPFVANTGGAPSSMLQGKTLADDHYADGGDERQQDENSPEKGKSAGDGDEHADEGENVKHGSGDDDQSGKSDSENTESEQESSEATPGIPNPLNSSLLRWIVWGIFGVVVLVFAWKHRQEIIDAIRQLWAGLLDFLGGARKKSSKKRLARTESETEETSALPRIFAELANPFSSGAPALSPDVVVERTYDALEVWAAENGRPRDREMTANEFARELTHLHPGAKHEINRLISLYSGSVYADRVPTADELPPLAKLWDYMRSRAPGSEGR